MAVRAATVRTGLVGVVMRVVTFAAARVRPGSPQHFLPTRMLRNMDALRGMDAMVWAKMAADALPPPRVHRTRSHSANYKLKKGEIKSGYVSCLLAHDAYDSSGRHRAREYVQTQIPG